MNRAKLVALAVAAGLAGCSEPEPPPKPPEMKDPTKVGFLYIGPIGDYGWSKAHDDGRQFLENFGDNVKTTYVENVTGAAAEAEIDRMYAEGHRLIFTTSYDLLPTAKKAAAKYDDLTVLNCSGFTTAPRLGSYQARIEEAEYLTGMVAGRMTKSNKIGVIGAARIYEQIMQINAFALGVQAVNPDAEVLVRWVGFWFDPEKEAIGTRELVDEGADIIKTFADTNTAIKTADELKVWSISHGSKDGCAIAPETCLVAAFYNWGPLYKKLTAEVIAGTYPGEGRIDYVSNAELEVSGISAFSTAVPKEVQELVIAKKRDIEEGRFNVFQGPFEFEDGSEVKEGEKLSDEQLICANLQVKGVTEFPGPACTVKADCANKAIDAELLDCVEGKCVAANQGGCPET